MYLVSSKMRLMPTVIEMKIYFKEQEFCTLWQETCYWKKTLVTVHNSISNLSNLVKFYLEMWAKCVRLACLPSRWTFRHNFFKPDSLFLFLSSKYYKFNSVDWPCGWRGRVPMRSAAGPTARAAPAWRPRAAAWLVSPTPSAIHLPLVAPPGNNIRMNRSINYERR